MKEQPSQRVLPQNLEAERSVLGAILITNSTFHAAAAILDERDFFRDAHRRVFKRLKDLSNRNEDMDLITLKNELEKNGELEDVGAAYLGSLVDGVPRSTSVVAYADIVRNMATLRALIATGSKIVDAGYAAREDANQVVTWAEQQMFDLAHGHVASRLISLRESSTRIMERLAFRVQHRGEVTGVDTGFKSINDETFGWQPGDLIFVGARPSIGKTTFVMNSVVAAAKLGKRIGVFSMEMKRAQLEDRLVSSLSGVPLTRMLGGALGGSDWAKITDAMEVMHDLPIYIDDTSARTIWDLRSAARQMQAELGIDEMVVDYVQLMKGSLDTRNANRNMELTDISNRFKQLAGEMNIPIIVLSQLARKSLDRPDPRPKMSDLKDCGAFEQDADVVALLHRKNHREGGVTNFILEKQRNGPTGTVNLTLDRDTVTFTDGGEEPAPEPKAPAVVRRRRPAGH